MNAAQFTQLMAQMQQQNQNLTDANNLLRTQLTDQNKAMTDAQAEQQKQMTALIEQMSPDNSVEHTGVLPPQRYPKLDDFNVKSKNDTDARTTFFVHRQAWANRFNLESEYRHTILEMKLIRDQKRADGTSVLQAPATQELQALKDAYANVLARRPPPSLRGHPNPSAPTPTLLPPTNFCFLRLCLL